MPTSDAASIAALDGKVYNIVDRGKERGHVDCIDAITGKTLWETLTPYSANATPMTYMVDGKQFVVVSAGGHAWSPLPKGDFILAFALPD